MPKDSEIRLADHLRAVACQFVEERIKGQSNLAGVLFLGAIGQRSWADEFSDIDISVLVKGRQAWLASMPFEFSYQNELMNVHKVNILEDHNYPLAVRSSISRGVLYLDLDGSVANWIATMTNFSNAEALDAIAFRLYRTSWDIENSARWIMRENRPQAELLASTVPELMLETLYLLQGLFPPAPKWLVALSSSLSDDLHEIATNIGSICTFRHDCGDFNMLLSKMSQIQHKLELEFFYKNGLPLEKDIRNFYDLKVRKEQW